MTQQQLATTKSDAMNPQDQSPKAAWSRRVRRIGGFIQAAFAAFWLVRGSLVIGGRVKDLLIAVFGVIVIGVFSYAVRVTTGAPRPMSPEAKRIERSVTISTILELIAAFILPVIVIAIHRSDWVLPSIAITIGPLLLWLDHVVDMPRYRLVGGIFTVAPVILVATMSGRSLVITTGIAAGVLLLATTFFGFHDLAGFRRRSSASPAVLAAKAT